MDINNKFLIESFEQFTNQLNEKVVMAPRNGLTKDDVEDLLKEHGDISLYVKLNKQTYFVTSHMHNKGKLEKANNDTFYPLDKTGKPTQIKFQDIHSVSI